LATRGEGTCLREILFELDCSSSDHPKEILGGVRKEQIVIFQSIVIEIEEGRERKRLILIRLKSNPIERKKNRNVDTLEMTYFMSENESPPH
jgi:hypothetical protein